MSHFPDRSTDEMEQLLRRTYSEVAARTTVGSTALRADAQVILISDARSTRWRPLLAVVVAAAVIVMVGGLLLLAGRGAEAPTGIGPPRHVVPGWVPSDSATMFLDDGGFFPLTELDTTDGRDRLVWSTGNDSITLEVDHSGRLPDGDNATVRGLPGRRLPGSVSLRSPNGTLATVTWTGGVDDEMIESFTRGLVFVDDDAWTELSSHGGFRANPSEPFSSFVVDADATFEIDLVGDLHQGVALSVGRDSSVSFRPTVIDRCRASVNYATTDFESVVGYFVVAQGAPSTASVRLDGTDQRTIEMTSLRPYVDSSVGGVVYDGVGDSIGLPVVDCGGGD